MTTLLGHLAQFSAFFNQGELLCTQGLAYLLGNRAAGSAFAAEIACRTGVDLPAELTWQAEAHQADGGRPDLEARDSGGTPWVKIEAKLSAPLGSGQLKSYARDLQQRTTRGALIVLVPGHRTAEAADAVQRAFGVSGPAPRHPTDLPAVAMAVVSWEDALEALAPHESEGFRFELAQFRAMYRVLAGYYLEPLTCIEQLLAWREREGVFVSLVDRVTQLLTTENGHRLLPMGVENSPEAPAGLAPKGYRRRYVCPIPAPGASCFSIGVRDAFPNHVTPIWMRFHSATGEFPAIRDRLCGSSLAARLVPSDGHIWLPLDVPLGVEGHQMVDQLAAQARQASAFAYGPRSAAPSEPATAGQW